MRAATPADAERIVAVTVGGLRDLPGVRAGGLDAAVGRRRARAPGGLLGEDRVWYRVAEHEGALVGHVGFLPAERTFAPTGDPGLAHFRQLFVARAHWGTGLATQLHGAALDEARARGFTGMRLFTPAAQQRARRFYEREGWALARPPAFDERIGLDIAEYRRAL